MREIQSPVSYHDSTDLLCASPLRRTIQTATIAFKPEIQRGLKILGVADAQEATDSPHDTGRATDELVNEFGNVLDPSLLEEGWFEKTGINEPNYEALRKRAQRLRKFLRDQPEKTIVLVTHGQFAHSIGEHVDPEGQQTGRLEVVLFLSRLRKP